MGKNVAQNKKSISRNLNIWPGFVFGAYGRCDEACATDASLRAAPAARGPIGGSSYHINYSAIQVAFAGRFAYNIWQGCEHNICSPFLLSNESYELFNLPKLFKQLIHKWVVLL